MCTLIWITSLPSSLDPWSINLVVLSGNGEIALRLSAALILGSALGLNRDLYGKPAGVIVTGFVFEYIWPERRRDFSCDASFDSGG
jgi:hypothetical protein